MVLDEGSLSAALRRARGGQEPPLPLEVALRRLVDDAATVLGSDGAGLMLIDTGQALRYAASSDDRGRAIDEAQQTVGDGPCIQAFVHDTTIPTPDCLEDRRWPGLAALLEPYEIRAVLSTPVRLGGGPVGTLNVYRREHHEWSAAEEAAVDAFARVVEHVLASAVAAHEAGKLAAQLQYALDYRVVIERAVGFLMARDGLDQVEAFDRLRRSARSSRRKVADIAADLLAGRGLP